MDSTPSAAYYYHISNAYLSVPENSYFHQENSTGFSEETSETLSQIQGKPHTEERSDQQLILSMLEDSFIGIPLPRAMSVNNREFIQAAFKGDYETVEALSKEEDVDINAVGTNGNTALIQAVQGDHYEIVNFLLKLPNIDVNIADVDGSTALVVAATKGNLEIVKALLNLSTTNVNAVDIDGRTALRWAVQNNHIEVIEEFRSYARKRFNSSTMLDDSFILVSLEGSEINNVKNNNASQEFIVAASRGDYETVKNLLTRESVDVNAVDTDGNTALMRAIQGDHAEIINCIIALPDINVNITDIYGSTALMMAAGIGNLEVVKALLSSPKINVNIADIDGRTALRWAAQNGYTEVIEALLSNSKIDINALDETGWLAFLRDAVKGHVRRRASTPLIAAAMKGHTDIVRALLKENNNIQVHIADRCGNTALMYASENGYIDIVEALLAAPKGNIFNLENLSLCLIKVGIFSKFPMVELTYKCLCNISKKIEKNHVADIGIEGAFNAFNEALRSINIKNKQTLFLFDSPLNNRNDNGDTALTLAARNGHTEIVRALLATSEIENIPNKDGNTAFKLALKNKHMDIVALLKASKIDTNIGEDNKIWEAAFEAAVKVLDYLTFNSLSNLVPASIRDVAKAQLKARIVETCKLSFKEKAQFLRNVNSDVINDIDEKGYNALMYAIIHKKPKEVNALLSRPDIKVDSKDKNGFTALMLAAFCGELSIVKALLDKGGFDINDVTQAGVTALMLAAQEGHIEIVKKFLGVPEIDVNIADNHGSTALTIASQYGRAEIVQTLLKKPGININAVDKDGDTAFTLAEKHPNIKKILQDWRGTVQP